MINLFSRGAREEVTSTVMLRGNRKLTCTGDVGELVDLDQEKVYTIDFGRQSYSVKTFDQMRKEWQDQQERMAKQDRSDESARRNEGPEYDVDFDIKSTGKKEEINGTSRERRSGRT